MEYVIPMILFSCFIIFCINMETKDRRLMRQIKKLLAEEVDDHMLKIINEKGVIDSSEINNIIIRIYFNLDSKTFAHIYDKKEANGSDKVYNKIEDAVRPICLGMNERKKEIEEYKRLETLDTEQVNEAKYAKLVYFGKYYFAMSKKAPIMGIVHYNDWSKQMIEGIGNSVKPHLEKIWAEITNPKTDIIERAKNALSFRR